MISTRFLFLATGILSTEVYGMSSPSPRDVPTSIGPLLSRQYSGSTTSSISSACVDSCAILYALANCADDDTCGCSDSYSDQYAVCMDCQVRLNNSLQTEAQQWMDTYVDACKEVGVAVKSQKISGAGRITIGAGAIGVVLMTVLAVL